MAMNSARSAGSDSTPIRYEHTLTFVSRATIPFFDVGAGAAVAHAERRQAEARAVRAACLGWLPLGGLLAWIGDPFVRAWMRRSGSPYVEEIAAIGRLLKRPGVWLLHGAYLFGCTALADEALEGPRLRRTLDWSFSGLGRLVEVVRQSGPAGSYLNVTWPGFVGVLTANAPGRFAASINQAPMRRRNSISWMLWLDYALNAVMALSQAKRPPPEHVLRQAFETCSTFDDACRLLETAPVARPVLFTVVGCATGERVVIEREVGRARLYRHDIVVANAWREERAGWRARCNTGDDPVTNNRQRRAVLSEWSGRAGVTFTWAMPPVLNKDTRLTVEMCPSNGHIAVMGWEPDGRVSVEPVTLRTEF
jgi:hypothetical protein